MEYDTKMAQKMLEKQKQPHFKLERPEIFLKNYGNVTFSLLILPHKNFYNTVLTLFYEFSMKVRLIYISWCGNNLQRVVICDNYNKPSVSFLN